MKSPKLFSVASLVALPVALLTLASCGGGDDDNRPARGSLVEPPTTLATLTAAQIDAGTAATGLQAITGRARCDVRVVALDYNTIGPAGERTNSSGVMLVPTGTCTAPSPLVAYAKATDVQKPRALANPQDPETFLLIATYAAQGYAVVASDFLGFARSAFPYHPFVHADSEASSVIDSIRAARNAAGPAGATLSGRVMTTGYSQGGHSSMAAQRNGERDEAAELNIVAGAYLAGPYNVSGMVRLTQAIAGYQFFVPYIITSYQKVYGNVYTDVNAVFKAPYVNGIENLLPSPSLNYTTLVSSGRLPGANGESPNQVRDELIQPAFLADTQNNPENALFRDAQLNDLLGWTPRAKVLLCGGVGDPTIPPAVNRDVLKADFDARGVTNVTVVDVDAMVQAAYGPGGVAPTDPTSAAFATYYGNYHGSYEPPFCNAQARAFFDTVR